MAPPAAVLLASIALAACSTAGDVLSDKLGGLPSDAPQRPAVTLPTPNVYEVRPTREARPLSDVEQKKLESELTTLREGQKIRANPPPAPKKVAAPAKKSAVAEKKAPAVEKKADAKDPVIPPTKQPVSPMKLMN